MARLRAQMPATVVPRRDVLRWIGSGAVLSAVGASTWGCSDTTVSQGDRVLVVGAGAAGLTVANALTTAGVEVVVLEGRERVGGRIWPAEIAGTRVDAGGMWLHGTRGNPAAAILAHEGVGWQSAPFFGFETRVFDSELQRSLSDDERIVAATASFEFDDAVEDLAIRLGPDATVAEAIALFLDDGGYDAIDRRHVEFGIQTSIELGFAQAPSDLSLVSYVGAEAFEGTSSRLGSVKQGDPDGDNFPDGTYLPLIDALARGVDVRLGTAVHRVESHSEGVTVETSAGRERGSHVVVTVPLGVLKAGTIEFSPALPQAKQTAIDRLDMAQLEKVVLRYDQAFWQLTGPGNVLYAASTLGEFPLLVDYSPFAGGTPTIVAFYCGNFGREIAGLDDAAIVDRANRAVNELSETQGRSPIDALVTRWKSDPFALGSYPGTTVRASVEDVRNEARHYEAMAAPAGERVLFAGDGTSYGFGSTVEGAVRTGIREAERLLGRTGEGVFLESGLLISEG